MIASGQDSTEPVTPADAGWQDRLKAANINPETCLATDYLNHFNEIAMLLEMVPDMPEMAAEVKDWQPKTYQQHFADSAFTAKALAIEAFAHAPEHWRSMLDRVTGHMDGLIRAFQDQLPADPGPGDIEEEAKSLARELHHLINLAGSIINGTAREEAVARLGAPDTPDTAGHFSQDDIDSLFD